MLKSKSLAYGLLTKNGVNFCAFRRSLSVRPGSRVTCSSKNSGEKSSSAKTVRTIGLSEHWVAKTYWSRLSMERWSLAPREKNFRLPAAFPARTTLFFQSTALGLTDAVLQHGWSSVLRRESDGGMTCGPLSTRISDFVALPLRKRARLSFRQREVRFFMGE